MKKKIIFGLAIMMAISASFTFNSCNKDAQDIVTALCKTCNGSGTCGQCKGSGVHKFTNGTEMECLTCKGTGKCPDCNLNK